MINVPQQRRKVSLRDDRMLPELAIVDPALTDNAPRAVTLGSGLDAITQLIEPWLCTRANPLPMRCAGPLFRAESKRSAR